MSDTNPLTDPNEIMINGPVNVIRLEGEIHGTKKVIYLFMDYHMSVNSQTQCSNVFSEDVQKYFTDSFYYLNEKDQIYDFFVEVYPTELSDHINKRGSFDRDYKEMYIEEVVKFFKKIFKYDPRKNKVSVNKLFKNIRLHYIDIRDYYKHNIHDRANQMNDIAHSFMTKDNIDLRNLDRIINIMEVIKTHLTVIIDILTAPSKKSKGSAPKIIRSDNRSSVDTDTIQYLATKIKESYKYDDVKRSMHKLLKLSIQNFTNTITDIDKAIDTFSQYGDDIYKSNNKLIKDDNTSYVYSYGLSAYTMRYMIVDIVNTVEKIVDEKFVEFFARFIDIYFLRRFLDKDYITHAITYTGALHSNTYVHTLINDFGFKITHASYSKYNNMVKLNSEISKKNLMDTQELILPKNFQQCSDLTHFPRDFM